MKKGITWLALIFVMVISLVLASCNTSTSTSTSSTTTTRTSTTVTSSTNTTTTTNPTASTVTSSNVTTTTTITGNWWDSLGTPTYGGWRVDFTNANITQWDPYLSRSGKAGFGYYMQEMWQNDYTVDPNIWDFSIGYIPPEYATGLMITGYEMPNSYTVVCHLRNDIYFQNIAPANGRQFTSADIVYHYNRMLGLGGGFTSPSPYYATNATWTPLLSVVANDKFTITFNWKQGTSPLSILSALQSYGADNQMECSDAVTQWGNLNDWHHAVGSGPYMLTDFVDGTSLTFSANPNYWAKDLRWPQNKLPYLDGIKWLIIANSSTAEAAFRVGKIDDYRMMPVQDALNMMKIHPEIIVKEYPQGQENTLDPRNDLAPFNDINVRIAMQHAINISLISSAFYQGHATPMPQSLTENQMASGGWGCAYTEWPASTQAEYTFDPALSRQMLATAGFSKGIKTTLIFQNTQVWDLYQIVQSELADVGITFDVTVLDTASWTSYVQTTHKYQGLAVGEIGILGKNSNPAGQLALFTTGYPSNRIMVSDPVIDKFYADSLTAQTIDAFKQILHDENLYVAKQHFAISVAQPNQFNLIQPWLKGVAGNSFLGNAENCVWIDLEMKHAFGH